MVTVVVEFTYVCRERGWWLFKGVLFFIGEIKGIAFDQGISLCGDSPMKWCTCACAVLLKKMLNRICPLMWIVNCGFGSICLASRCTTVKFLQPNKILGYVSLQEETWWLLSADASLKPGEKHVLAWLGFAPTSAGIAPGYWWKVHGLQRAWIILVE